MNGFGRMVDLYTNFSNVWKIIIVIFKGQENHRRTKGSN